MAKELPYFKFEPSQWENGTIQLCTFEEQGVFIAVCSMYWQRVGDLPYKLAVQKICRGNATALDSLYEQGIFTIVEGMICIDFLNEQLAEFNNLSAVNAENARLGWEKRRNKATAKRPQSEPNAIREEKKKEDEIKKQLPQKFSDDYYQSKEQAFEEIKQDDLYMDEVHRTVTGKGWRVATKVHVLVILKKFLIVKADLESGKKNVRQHFKNYLFSQSVSNLVQIADEG